MNENQGKIVIFADFTFEKDGNVLIRNGETVSLEPSSARVLRYFLENGGRLISKEEILDAVWRDVFTTEDVLKRAVSQIRRALGDDAQNPRFIETLHRRGYRFLVTGKKSESIFEVKKAENLDPHFDCFIGRAAEMDFLQSEFRRCAGGGKHSPVLIFGEPGIGKTQTATRFADWAEAEKKATPLRVRFFDYEASFLPPLDVFLDLLTEACNEVFDRKTEKNDLPQIVREKLQITLPDELFNHSNEARKTVSDASRMIAPLAESFVRLSRIRPLILIFDDVQWADETSRQIIGYLMRTAQNAPLMIVGLTRRGEAENSQSPIAEWLQHQAVYRSFTMLELAPISAEDCRAIIAEVFRGQLDTDEISVSDLLKLHQATGGNPYFLIETLRILMNENLIAKDSSNEKTRWHWRGIGDVPLPETVRMAARAKLAKLSKDTRELVDCAAILGDTFQIKTLELMSEMQTDDLLESYLDEAVTEQVLTEQNVSGEDDCQFYHTTLRRAVYMDLSPRRRKRLHLRAMRAIENSHTNELEKFAAALAAHAENADEFEKSFQLNLQACRAAVGRFDWLEAAELLTRARRSAEKIGAHETSEFLALQGEIYMSVGRRAEAEKILAKAAEKTNSASILLNLGRTQILLGKYRKAIPALEKSLAAAQSSNDDFTASAALIQLASAKYALCEYEDSSAILQKIIDEKEKTDYNRAVALGKLGWTRALQSRYAEGKKLLREALDFHQTAGDMRERAVLSMCLNWCEYGAGNYEAAIEYAIQARHEAQIVGEPYNESVAMMRIAKARIAQGIYAEAEDSLEKTWEKQKDLDAPHAQAETIWMRGKARLAQGNLQAAEEDFKTAFEMIVSVGDRDDEFRILLDQAILQNRGGNFTEAIETLNRSAQIAEEIGITEGIGEILTEKSYSLLKLKNFSAAVEIAEKAIEILENCNSGKLWQAFYALASAEKDKKKIENNLRRAVEILEKMREQFSPKDETRRRQFIISHNQPAKNLCEFLKFDKRRTEAEEIAKTWLIVN